MNILYATDGSPGALAGARFLTGLSLSSGDQIQLLTVVPDNEAGTAEGKSALQSSQNALCGTEACITLNVRRGSTAGAVLETILRISEEQPTDLIVVGTHGHSAIERFILGSVAARVARYAHCPVLIARPFPGLLDQVVLCVDGSAGSDKAAEWLQAFPLAFGCEVCLTTIVTSSVIGSSSHFLIPAVLLENIQELLKQEKETAIKRLEELTDDFAAVGKRSVTDVRAQETTSGLLDVIAERSADLIVVGSNALTGIDRFLLGSVSEKLLNNASCSVLIVRFPS